MLFYTLFSCSRYFCFSSILGLTFLGWSAQFENYGAARSSWQKNSVNVPNQTENEEACEWNSETPGKVVCSLVKGGAILPPEIGYAFLLLENMQELLRGKAREYRKRFLLR